MTKIAIVGEAWGAEEAKERRPFIGITGQHLTFMLNEAGINRSECFITNVFNLRPASNKIESLTGDNSDALPNYPPILKGKCIHKKYAPELQRLQDELLTVDPNITILLGNVALWALQGKNTISRHRGCVEASTHTVTGFKTIATYHPASILPRRSPENRPVIVADLIKAERESHFQEIRRPECEIWINPTLEDLYEFERRYIHPGKDVLSVDIETTGSRITTVGFAPSPRCAIVIPFDDSRRKGHCYWPSQETEKQAWIFVRRILGDPTIRKLFQNGLYDIAFLWRAMKIKVINASEDTMLLHHALQPESLKGLGFLGSLYTDHGSWKQLRQVNTIKRDD